jgi:hypothetical protein
MNHDPIELARVAVVAVQALRAKDLNETFPVLDPEAAPTANPRGFASLLWKQLDHLGNAGFDPALFRVDAYGNVLYLHADSASPLAWDVAHWFPCASKTTDLDLTHRWFRFLLSIGISVTVL